jgi:hypothetical protein
VRPKLRRYGRNRVYLDLDRPIPGRARSWEKIPGVTTIVRKGMPKEVFATYAGTATAAYAVNNWDELSTLPPAERLSRLNRGRYEDRDKAGDRGQEIHELARQIVRGAEVPVPDEIHGYVTAAVKFLDEFDVRPFAEELIVFNETEYYCGQLDLGATVLVPDLPIWSWVPVDDQGRSRSLIDWKSGRSGIFGELSLQLSPYRYAEFAIEDGEVIEVPEFDFGMGVHLRPDGTYSAVPVEIGPEQFDDFLAVKRTAEVADKVIEYVMSEMTPPLAARYVLTKIAEGVAQ